MRFGSVCSGIEAASQAWNVLGWEAAFFSEIEPFPCAVLAHHHPHVPNHGDMTKFAEWPDHAIDLLVGGTPCQSFSIAGLRAGLADPRGNLMLTYLAIAARYQPRWLVWENVPGVLSSNDGRDFGTFLGALGELGYGFAYRVLDAQFCRAHGYERAVPQRRRRVFVVGYLGDWRRAAAVLFDGASLRGDPAPDREAGKEVAGTPSASSGLRGGMPPGDTASSRCLEPSDPIIKTLMAKHTRHDPDLESYVTEGPIAFEANMSLQQPDTSGVHPTLTRRTHASVAYDLRGREGGAQFEGPHDTANIRAASGGSSRSYVAEAWAVRRLMPVECERLQGFPDGHTLVPYRGKPASDGPRYKALGNSMAVNAMRVLGTRIQQVEELAS
jgi:DNA (cytosine-5)-methyltransferase 1